MVGVAAEVASARPVYGPAAVDFVQVAVAPRLQLLRLFIGKPPALIFDDEGVLLDQFSREQAKSGTRTSNPKGFLASHSRDIGRFGDGYEQPPVGLQQVSAMNAPVSLTPPYKHTPLFPLGADKTPYRKLTGTGVRVEKIMGAEMLMVEF